MSKRKNEEGRKERRKDDEGKKKETKRSDGVGITGGYQEETRLEQGEEQTGIKFLVLSGIIH